MQLLLCSLLSKPRPCLSCITLQTTEDYNSSCLMILYCITFYITLHNTLHYITFSSLYGTFSLFLIKLTSTRLADHLVFNYIT